MRGLDTFLVEVVSSTGRLVARAAIAGGRREPLGWTQDLFLLSMADELEARGVPRAVAADMLGMSRRTLIRRLGSAKTTLSSRPLTLWSRVRRALKVDSGLDLPSLEAQFRGSAMEVGTLARDMLAAGWATERNGRIRAHPDEEIEVSQVVDLLRAWSGQAAAEDLEAAAVAERFDLPLKLVERALAHLDPTLAFKQSASNRWMALKMAFEATQRFFFAKIDGREDAARGGAWAVRVDHLPEEVPGRLRAQVETARQGVSTVVAEVAARKPYDLGPQHRLWTAVLLETLDES